MIRKVLAWGVVFACCLGLAGCSTGSGAEGVAVEGTPAVSTAESSAQPTAEPTVSAPKSRADALEFNRPRDPNGKPIWPDGVVGRGYEIPPQLKDAPPLPQWVKDFNPEMPEAARQPTEAGAKAFAEYAFATFFYEVNTGTTSLARSISKRQNSNFLNELDALDKKISNGAWARMSKFEIISSNILEAAEDKTGYIIEVSYKASMAYEKSDAKGISEEKPYKGKVSIFQDAEGEWSVYQLAFPHNYVK